MQNHPVNPPHPSLCVWCHDYGPKTANVIWSARAKRAKPFHFQEAPGSTPRPPIPAPAAPSQSPAAGLVSSGTTQGPPNLGPPTPPTMVGAMAPLPPTGTFSQTVISSGSNGQAPSQEVDACASTAFSGIMVSTHPSHYNWIRCWAFSYSWAKFVELLIGQNLGPIQYYKI